MITLPTVLLSYLVPVIGLMIPLNLPIVMIPQQVDTGFLAAFVTGGLGAMAWATVQVWRAIKAGQQSDEADEYARLERAATYEAALRAFTETERDYWHRRSAAVEYELTRSSGLETTQRILTQIGNPPEAPKPPPQVKGRNTKPQSYKQMMAGFLPKIPGSFTEDPSQPSHRQNSEEDE